MKTLRDEKCRNDLIGRINKLTPETKATWGKMSVEQMLSHLVHSNELPFVETVPDVSNFMSRTVVKKLALYVLPMPKQIKTSPQMDQQQNGRKPMGFDADKASLIESIAKVGTLAADYQCLGHPFFGKMSAEEWGVLGHKHMDHHLRQFGV